MPATPDRTRAVRRPVSSGASPGQRLRDALRELAKAAMDGLIDVAREGVAALADRLDDIADSGRLPVPAAALLGAVRAGAAGRNPVWGGLVGGMRALSPAARVAIVVALVLAVLLLPLTVLLILLALLVLVVVLVVRAAGT
jgi:hypothetical protein